MDPCLAMSVDVVLIVKSVNAVMEIVATAFVTMILGSLLLLILHLPLRSGLPLPKLCTNPDLVDPSQGTPPLGDNGQGQDLDQDLRLRW